MRTYKRKTERGKSSAETFRTAAKEVLDNGRSLRTVADEYSINFMTLHRYCKKMKNKGTIYFYMGYSFDYCI